MAINADNNLTATHIYTKEAIKQSLHVPIARHNTRKVTIAAILTPRTI